MKSKTLYTVAAIILSIYAIIRLINFFTPDPVNKELITYVNDKLIPAEVSEHRAIAAYNAVSGSNYKDDKTMSDSLVGVTIPKYSEFSTALKAIVPKTNEVSLLHKQYIAAADTQLSGFTLLEQAIEKQDSGMAGEAGRRIQAADKAFSVFDHSLDSLADSHDVEITRKKK